MVGNNQVICDLGVFEACAAIRTRQERSPAPFQLKLPSLQREPAPLLSLVADKHPRAVGEADRYLVGGDERLDTAQSKGFVFDPIPLAEATGHAVYLVRFA